MAKHEKFNFKSYDDFKTKIAELGVKINLSEDFNLLAKKVKVGHLYAPNAFAVLPEGRANPQQMMLTKENKAAFAKTLAAANSAAKRQTAKRTAP